MNKVTTLEMEIAVMKYFDIQRNLIVTGITNSSKLPIMFESDVLILTKSNYAHCVEIKVSKSDLKNDLKKKHIKAISEINTKDYYKSLNRFSYAVPEYLKEEALLQIPDFCGLWIYYSKSKFQCIRSPKEIRKYKWTERERYEMARLGAIRNLQLKKNILKLTNKANE